MNQMTLAGHLGSEPEERVTPGGQKVTNFRMATKARKGGEDVTIWYRVTIWGDRFARMMPYLKKGSAVLVTGELQKPDVYTDRNGQPQVGLEVTAEIVRFSPFGRANGEEQNGQQPFGQQSVNVAPAAAPAPAAAGPALDDDLPF